MKDAQQRLEESVIEGKDQFLFHRDHDAVEQTSGKLRFTQSELDYWVKLIEARSEWCRENNIIFRMMIVPEKHVVYAHLLPSDIHISEDRPASQILRSLSPRVAKEVLYPLDQLRARNSDFKTYFKTDTHWTELGAFVAYELLMQTMPMELGVIPIESQNLGIKNRQHTGDLGVRLEPEQQEQAMTLSHSTYAPFKRVYENKKFNRGNTAAYESSCTSAPRLVVFRDSFFNYVIPHLIPSFSRTVVVSSIDMHYDLIRSEQPQVLIFEIIERYLGYLDSDGERIFPTDSQDVAFESFSGVSPVDLKLTSA